MKKIDFTTASWIDIDSKIKTVFVFAERFNGFDISPFLSDSIHGLFFIFQAYPKDFAAFKVNEYTIHRRKTKVLEIYLILDYEKLMAGTDAENLQHVKEVFVHGCEKFLKLMKGFRYEEFWKEIDRVSSCNKFTD